MKRGKQKASVIDVVEAAYDVDLDEAGWLEALTRRSAPALDDGFGIFAFTYDASTPEQMSIGHFAQSAEHKHFDATSALAGILSAGGGKYVQETFRSLQVEGTRSTPGFVGSDAERGFDALGIGDLLVVNGVDPSGIGLCIGAVTRARVLLTGLERERFSRVATHLANGHRLRRRLARLERSSTPWGAEAVLTPAGRMEHAGEEGLSLAHTRERLREATLAVDRARGKLRRIDADRALGEWLGLVDGRWSLVDTFDRDGKRYVLVRGNEPQVSGLSLLTERERAVVGYAAMGHSNKQIAYDLGIAHATVRVLLSRAAKRLGARTRAALLEAVAKTAEALPQQR